MMRLIVLACLMLAPFVAADDENVFSSEEHNFKIRLPKFSVDWKFLPISEKSAKDGMRLHMHTEFADTEPRAEAHIYISIMPLAKKHAHKSLDKIVKEWAPFMEGHLANPRERKEEAGKFGEVENYRVDVKGDHLAGIHQRTWYIAKNGKRMYLMYVDRNYRAVGDEDLDDEIKEIVGSFRFLKVEPVAADKKGKAQAPKVGGPGGKGAEEAIDPELLRKETFKEPFWKFRVTKPEGLLKKKLTDADKKIDIKYSFANDRQSCRLQIFVYAQTERAKKWTIEQLLGHKLSNWEKEVKVSKDPKINKRYKFPMAKKAIRIDLAGRSTRTIHRIYVLMDCKNDRQYQLEIYVSGTQGMQLWGKTIDSFLKNFKPVKK
ncbi:MAG: hypothetical protein O7E54_01440 [Planctomycetota bacterium]|nr:hypothetical protein [Planctomycetota bacterium]